MKLSLVGGRINPQKEQDMIKFVRRYNKYGSMFTEVVHNNRVITYIGEDQVPKTVKDYIEKSECREQIDRWNGKEQIWEAK